jgi:secretion/DNA translocation related TadE-like protein
MTVHRHSSGQAQQRPRFRPRSIPGHELSGRRRRSVGLALDQRIAAVRPADAADRRTGIQRLCQTEVVRRWTERDDHPRPGRIHVTAKLHRLDIINVRTGDPPHNDKPSPETREPEKPGLDRPTSESAVQVDHSGRNAGAAIVGGATELAPGNAEVGSRTETVTRSFRRVDRGSATLWGVALMGLMMAVAMVFATVGAARVARHRVHGAADLSALAAARLVIADPARACPQAAEIAKANGVRMARCVLTGEVADIWTELDLALPGLGTRTVTGRSRAGPSWTTVGPGPSDAVEPTDVSPTSSSQEPHDPHR